MLQWVRRFGKPVQNLRHSSSKLPPSSVVVPTQLLDLLVCPLSKDQLVKKDQSLQSQAAGISYPIMHVHGHMPIVNMIPRDATLLLDGDETVV